MIGISVREIPGYENLYACDENGDIFSLPRIIKRSNRWEGLFDYQIPFKKLSQCTTRDGYKIVSLRKDGKAKSFLVHRLIGKTFLCMKDDQELNHIDGNKINNKVSNLELSSRSENIKHAFRIGLKNHRAENHPRYYIDQKIREKVLDLLKSGLSQPKIATLIGISQTAVSGIKLKSLGK